MTTKNIWNPGLGPKIHGTRVLLGTVRSDEHSNQNVKSKQTNKGLEGKTTLHVHHTFLYISLPFLHDYDVKSGQDHAFLC